MTLIHEIAPFVEAGFAVHWLHKKSKRPVGEEWQDKPVATLDLLTSTYLRGYNVGVRLGEWSHVEGLYLHVIDIDIRIAELADEAWAKLRDLLPCDPDDLPMVRSGSGGASCHLYLLTDRPFRSKKLATSDGKHRDGDSWRYDYEIEFFGTGKQVAMPPSIHPDSGKAYEWVRPFDFLEVELGGGPSIASADLETLGAVDAQTFAYESREPLDLKPGQMERELDLVEVSDLDYDDWLRLGQAIHHQTGASDEGWELWLQHSRRSTRHVASYERTMRRKWRSFGKYRGTPVTFATIREWVRPAREALQAAEFDVDDFDDLPEEGAAEETDFEAELGGNAGDPGGAENDETKSDLPWTSLLDVNEEGALRPTLHNVELLIKNDPRLIALPQLNLFTMETVQRTPPGMKKKKRRNAAKETRQLSGRMWDVKDTRNGDIWSSARDYAIRSILEAPKTQGGYGTQVTDRNLKSATVLAAWENSFHPVQEYLKGVKWDGVPRVERLFVDYLGANNDAYTRSVGRMMMVAAVTRVFEPGHKYDFAVILEGLQGRGKSTFIRTLGRNWFAELEGDFHDGKEMVEKMQGAWIMEIPELSGFNRADVRSIKAFISRQVDKVRLAYEARAADFPRQCIFIGSTNDKEYLKDDTGGRRFWPIECRVEGIDNVKLRNNVDQLWAEAYTIYRQMRAEKPIEEGELPLYLSDTDAADTAARLQESRRVESADDALAGRIAAWLENPIVSGDIADESDGRSREHTCLLQIWCEVMGGDMRGYNQASAQMIGRSMRLVSGWVTRGKIMSFPQPYGRQRFYERLGALPPSVKDALDGA